jgi:hypothetical protein
VTDTAAACDAFHSPSASQPLLTLEFSANRKTFCSPVYAEVKVTGRPRVRPLPEAAAVAVCALTLHWLLESVTAAPGVAGADEAVPASLTRNNWFEAFA